MDLFFIKIILAGIGISLCASSIGCFVTWKRMAYFGDSISHSILLGVIIAICFNTSPLIGGFLFAILIAVTLNLIDLKSSKDSILGIISQSCLALTIIINSYLGKNLNLENYLFGDILSVEQKDIFAIYILLLIILIWLRHRFKSLILIIISKELAIVGKIKVKQLELELTLFIAMVITFGIKIVGVLLINALVIMPSITAKIFSNSPKQMLLYANLLASIATICGIIISNYIDLPIGSMIIVVNLIFLISLNMIIFLKNR